jgi:hypothetical protein
VIVSYPDLLFDPTKMVLHTVVACAPIRRYVVWHSCRFHSYRCIVAADNVTALLYLLLKTVGTAAGAPPVSVDVSEPLVFPQLNMVIAVIVNPAVIIPNDNFIFLILLYNLYDVMKLFFRQIVHFF